MTFFGCFLFLICVQILKVMDMSWFLRERAAPNLNSQTLNLPVA